MYPNDTTDQGKAAMQEFGVEAVPLDQPGAPTPARIAERLSDIAIALDQAVVEGDLGAIVNASAAVGRLRMALDAWHELMKGQEATRSLTDQEFLDELQKVADAPTRPAPEEWDEEDHSCKRLFRRRAWYSALWFVGQVVVATDEWEAQCEDLAYEGEGEFDSSVLDEVDDVVEISPDDLDEAEARAVAEYIAVPAEIEQVKQMSLDEIRQWLEQKFADGDDSEDEGQDEGGSE